MRGRVHAVAVLVNVEKITAALRARFASRAAEGGAHRDQGVSTPARWLSRQTGHTSGKARADLGLAAGFDELSVRAAGSVAASVSKLTEAREDAGDHDCTYGA